MAEPSPLHWEQIVEWVDHQIAIETQRLATGVPDHTLVQAQGRLQALMVFRRLPTILAATTEKPAAGLRDPDWWRIPGGDYRA
jgi:hypothetical protein